MTTTQKLPAVHDDPDNSSFASRRRERAERRAEPAAASRAPGARVRNLTMEQPRVIVSSRLSYGGETYEV